MTTVIAFQPSSPLAHVSYVVDSELLESLSGRDWAFLLSPLSDPLYVALIIVTLVVTVACFAACHLVGPLRSLCQRFHNRLLMYMELVPLMLRVSLGMALIVAGVGDAVFLPNVPAGGFGGFEVGVGFCMVFGFMVRASGMAALTIFCCGLAQSHYLLGAWETAAAALLLIAYKPTRPSVDSILDIDPLGDLLAPVSRKLNDFAPLLLRLALGSTLIWLAITEKAFNPRLCEAVVIDFGLEDVIPVSTAMWVFSVGVIEIAVGTVLVLGVYTRCFCLITMIILTLSFFYFKEDVAGHVTFFGSAASLTVMGAGRFSFDSWIAHRTRAVKGTAVPYPV